MGNLDGEGPTMGLWARADFYYKNPVDAAKTEGESNKALLERYGDTSVAWLRTLQSLDPRQRRARPLAVRVIINSLTLLTGTQNVERFLGQVRLIELKHRARALGNSVLEASLKLNTQNLYGRRVNGRFDIEELILGPAQSAAKNVQYRASRFAVQCQQAYREFFGDRKLASRTLDQPASRSAAPPPLGRVQSVSGSGTTLSGEKAKHTQAVQDMVAKSGEACSLQPVADALADVAAARSSASSAPASRKRAAAEQTVDDPAVPQTMLGHCLTLLNCFLSLKPPHSRCNSISFHFGVQGSMPGMKRSSLVWQRSVQSMKRW